MSPATALPSSPSTPTAGWRKRHPVAARLVLYALAVGVGLGLYAAWRARQEQDREDHIAYLWSRLEALPVVLQADPSGPEVLKALGAEFSDVELPAALRARVERLRGVIARNVKDRAGVDAAFARARTLDPALADLVDLEWAQCLVDLGEPAAARERLPEESARPGWGWAGTIWAVVVRAQADALAGAPSLARAALSAALDTLPRPLPVERPLWFGLAAWQPAGAALEATRWLVLDASGGGAADHAAWERLGELAGKDVEALLASAEGLLGAGDPPAARRAWERASALDAASARRALAERPGLAALRER